MQPQAQTTKMTTSGMTIPKTSRHIVLVSKPSGLPTVDNFRVSDLTLPALQPGQFLVRNHFIAMDPFLRLGLNEKLINKTMNAYTVGDIIATTLSDQWPLGTYVCGLFGSLEYCITDGNCDRGIKCWRVEPNLAPLSTSLGVLGMPGATAWLGQLDCAPFPKGGTVVVSCAAGTVGHTFGQLCKKIRGCGKLIGITGGPQKCQLLLQRGFDFAIDHKSQDVYTELKKVCPDGIDNYFDCVGGNIRNQCLLMMKHGGSVTECGSISEYNGEQHIKLSDDDQKKVDEKKLQMFQVNAGPRQAEWYTGFNHMSKMLKSGDLKYDETIMDGFENIPSALISVFQGKNVGKMIVRLGAASTAPPVSSAPVMV